MNKFYLAIAKQSDNKTNIGLVYAADDGDAFKKASVLYGAYSLVSLRTLPLDERMNSVVASYVTGGTNLLSFVDVEEEW